MFKPREQFAAGQVAGVVGGPCDGAAVLSLAQVLPDDERGPARFLGMKAALRGWRDRAFNDFVPDLAQDIGSPRWFRGFATMLGLGIAAFAFWPDFSSLQAAPAMRIDAQSRDQFRSQMIMPLALGGDSGEHMGATAMVVPLKSAPERPRIEMVATLAQGDSFGRMLERSGLGAGEAERVASLVAGRVPLAQIEPGTRVNIVLGARPAPGAPRPLDSMSLRARFDLELALERRGGALVAVPRPIPVDATPLRIRGRVGASLYRSARAAGVPASAVQQYLRTLDDHVRIDSDISPTDEFDIILDYKRAATGEAQPGDLLYAGLESNGRPRAQLLRWGKDGHFFEATGVGEQRSGLLAPVNGRITSGFGMRFHPLLGYVRMHAGIDFGAAYGAPIYAVNDGRVTYAGRHGGHGNYVRLDHGSGFGTGYGHMSRIAVSPGDFVRRGQVIGYVGSTGLSTGPHLHYEVYRNGQTVNPASVQFVMRAQLEGDELRQFRARLDALRSVAPGAALRPLAQTALRAPGGMDRPGAPG